MNEPDNPYASPQADISIESESEGNAPYSHALRRIGIGLSLMYYCIIIVLLALIPGVMGYIVRPALRSEGFDPIYTVLMLIVEIDAIIGLFFYCVGEGFCVNVPKKIGARGYNIAALAFCLIGFMLLLLGNVSFAQSSIASGLYVFASLSGLSSIISQLLFMRQLSKYLGCSDIMRRISNIFIIGFGLILIIFASLLVTLLFHDNAFTSSFLRIVLPIGGIAVFLMYANTINALRTVVLEKSSRVKRYR